MKFKNHDFFSNSRDMEAELSFITFKARLAFTKLRQIFIKASILYYFNSEYHIWIKTNIFRYTISEILS